MQSQLGDPADWHESEKHSFVPYPPGSLSEGGPAIGPPTALHRNPHAALAGYPLISLTEKATS